MGEALKAVTGAGLIAGAIVGEILDPALTPLWVSMGSMGVSMEIGAIAQALEGSQGNFSIRQAAAPGQAIYGMSRVSGTIVWASTTGGSKDQLNLVVVWSLHPCESIESLYIDGKQVYLNGLNASGEPMAEPDNNITNLNGDPTAGSAVNATYYDINGNQYNWNGCVDMYNHMGGSDSVNPFLNYLTPNDPNFPDAAYFNGLTASYIKLTWNSNNFTGGIPEIRATIRGNKSIYDPRSGSTGWSDNMALCINNLLCDTNYGAGCIYDVEIDEAQLVAAANACDEQVNLAAGSTESRYSCNGSFLTESSVGDAVQSMLTSCAGRLTYTSGKFGIFPGVWLGTSDAEITTSNLIGNPSGSAVRKYRDLVNMGVGTFICPVYPYATGYNFDYQDPELIVFNGCWQPTNFPYWTNDTLHGYATDTDYITQDQGRTLTVDLKLQYVISVAAAQRIAKINVMRNRYQATMTAPCNLSMWQCTALDNIDVLFPYAGIGGTTFEVSSVKFEVTGDPGNPEEPPKLTTELELSATDPSVYAWSTSEELGILITASPTINDAFQIASPTDLSVASGAGTAFVNESGVVTGRIAATWVAPADTFITDGGYIEVQWQVVGASSWETSGLIGGNLESYLCSPCTGNASYNIRVRGQRVSGVSSGWVQVSDYTCQLVASTIDATDMYYADGSTVESLEPSMPAADVTNAMTPIMVINPGFEAGTAGWVQSEASIQYLPANAYAGGWVGLSAAPSSGYGYLLNTQATPVKPGQVVTAQCMVNASQPTAGYACVFLVCNNSTGGTVEQINGNLIAAGTPGWNVSYVVAPMPPGTVSFYVAARFVGPPTTGNFFVDNFSANFQTTSLSEIPLGSVLGNGATGVNLSMSATAQDIPLNCCFNAQFAGTDGDQVLGNGSDGQPTVPTSSPGLDIWHSVAGNTPAEFYGSSVVYMPPLSTGDVTVLCQFIEMDWLGIPGSRFCFGVQVAWSSTTEPNEGFEIYICPANSSSNFDPPAAVSASFPASAFTNTEFQTCILQGNLPGSGTWNQGYVVVIQHNATNQGYFICQPMLTYGAIMPIWTTQYPVAPYSSGNTPILHFDHINAGAKDPATGEPWD